MQIYMPFSMKLSIFLIRYGRMEGTADDIRLQETNVQPA